PRAPGRRAHGGVRAVVHAVGGRSRRRLDPHDGSQGGAVMSMATRCIACGTIFRVVQDQLKVSEGWVRCGQCREVFNALEQLFDLERDGIPATAAEVPAGDVRHAFPATVRAAAPAQPNEAPAPDDAVPEPPVEVAGLAVEELDVADADPPPEIAALD